MSAISDALGSVAGMASDYLGLGDNASDALINGTEALTSQWTIGGSNGTSTNNNYGAVLDQYGRQVGYNIPANQLQRSLTFSDILIWGLIIGGIYWAYKSL